MALIKCTEIKRKAKKKKMLLIASASVAVVALVVFAVIKLVVIPTNQYNQAVALRAAGNDAEAYAIFNCLGAFKDAKEICNTYDYMTNQYNQAAALRAAGNDAEAYAIFNCLGDFKDAKEICNTYDYMDALAYIDEGLPEAAFYLLNDMSDYPKAKTKVTELLNEHPYFSILCAAPGEEVLLGTYEQDNNISNGPEAIEWIVLKNENGVIYAVSKYILDAQVYNTHNGDGSTLKGWLKDDFYNAAFTDIPNGFVSKVGLLSRDDMSVYHSIANTKPEWTAYSKAQGPENHYYAGYSWWLDGEYFHGYGSAGVDMAVVIESGSYSSNVSTVTGVNGVRPAIIIDCTPNPIDYYSSDYSDIDNAGVTTRTEADVHYIGGNDGNNSSGAKRYFCSWCSGDGKTHDWGTAMHGSGYTCGKCGGDGWIDEDD